MKIDGKYIANYIEIAEDIQQSGYDLANVAYVEFDYPMYFTTWEGESHKINYTGTVHYEQIVEPEPKKENGPMPTPEMFEALLQALTNGTECEYNTPERTEPIPVYLAKVDFSGEIEIRPRYPDGFNGLSNNIKMREKDFIIRLPGMVPYDYIKLYGNEMNQIRIREQA